MSYTVAIVDDHLLVAKAISDMVENFNGFEMLYECENGKELTERFKLKRNIPDLVLLDISMPVMDGFETAVWLKQNHPEVKVMALTREGDDESLIKMIKCGATGYLKKNVHPTELEKALRSIIDKGLYYPDWATSRMAHALGNNAVEPAIKISDKEKEFLTYCCTQLTYSGIAKKMNCSPRTVEGYRDALFEELGVRTRVALALYAVKIGLHKL